MTSSPERDARSTSERKWLLIGSGYLVAAFLGAMLISPSGPGSDRPAYVCLMVYSLLVAVFCSRGARLVALFLAIVFFGAIISETKARREFGQRLRQHLDRNLEMQHLDGKGGMEKDGRGKRRGLLVY